jgi:DNA-binding transcriptional LysR family regulator
MRKNDDLAAWRIFFRVVELGSISKAASEANVEPSSVSRRISTLESRVGAQLLTRTARAITLTDAGSQAYEKIRVLIGELDSATDELQLEHTELSGLIRLSAPISLGDHDVLVQWLAEFQKQNPQVEIELMLSNAYVDLLESNIDLAIRIGALKDERLIARSLGDMHAIMCASPDYLTEHGTPTHPSELTEHRKVIYTGMMARGKISLTRFGVWRRGRRMR